MKINIGENIKKLRAEKQVTQEQLAEYLCISYQAVSKWENGVTTPDIFLLPKIAEYFDVPIDELFKTKADYKNRAARLLAIYEHRQTNENFNKADAEYEKLIAANKADGTDMRSYGILNQFHALELNKKAEKILNQAIGMGRKGEAQLIGLLASQGRNQENIDKYEEITKNEPNDPLNWYMLAYSYGGDYGKGNNTNPEKALEICKKGLEKFPNHDGLLSHYAEICRGLEKYDEAIEYFKKSIAQNPNMGDPYYGMAFTYTDMKKYKEAIESWEEVIALYNRLGLCEEEIEMGTEWPKREIEKLRRLL